MAHRARSGGLRVIASLKHWLELPIYITSGKLAARDFVA